MPSDEKPHIHKYESPAPIPTYEEATGSRSHTPNAPLDENAEPEEREGLLGGDSARAPVENSRRQGYRAPTVEDGRESLDSLVGLGPDEVRSSAEEDEEVRREIEEMEIEEPPTKRSKWGQRISTITKSIKKPFKRWPRLSGWKFKLPSMPTIDVSVWLLMARVVAVGIVVGMAYLLFVSDIFSNAATRMQATMYDPERVRAWFQEQVNREWIEDYIAHITGFDHMAGTEGDFVMSSWVQQKFVDAGLEDITREQYDVYLNFPKSDGRAVEILNADGSVKWTAKLDEDQIDPQKKQAKAFHGHSKSGDVKGPLIYANYGSREDFQRLKDMNIDTKGAIALVRYYGTQGDRALKVKAAELAGFAGCLIYSDPNEDGFVKGPAYPQGRYMPADGVQRGAVSLMSWVVGDVLTPGWASTPDKPRVSPKDSKGLVQIPSLPLAWRDAQVLLKSIQGQGARIPEASWMGGVPDVAWWTGNLSSPTVHLRNEQDENGRQPIWNIHGRIKGLEQGEKKVIIGNHRDAWALGAADPGSGTAVLLEVVRIFGDLKRHGWRPLRTIEFVSWDGEEYNLIGSTEHVEENVEELRKNGYVYLNVDVAVSGRDFFADGSPMWHDALFRVLNRIRDPNKGMKTLLDIWKQTGSQLGTLGAGSDYVAFQDIAGVSSIDFGFRGEKFPYHSVYDNYDWMVKHGDPGFTYHSMMAQIWGLLVLEMSDAPILPLSLNSYAAALVSQVEELHKFAAKKGANGKGKVRWDVASLRAAAHNAVIKAAAFEMWGRQWSEIHWENGNYESTKMMDARLEHNNRAAAFETLLLDLEQGGGVSLLLPRPLYKKIANGRYSSKTENNLSTSSLRHKSGQGTTAHSSQPSAML